MRYTRFIASIALLAAAGCSTGIRSNESTSTNNQVFSSSTPVVVTASPAGNHATDKQIFIGFSRPMDAATLKSISVSEATVSVNYDAANRIAYLRSQSALQANHDYMVTVPSAVTTVDGVAVPVAHTFKVTTRETNDTSSPGVHVVGAGCLPTNGKIRVIFDEDMDSTTINTSTFIVAGVTGSVSYDAVTRIATFTPSAELTAGVTYTVTLTTDIKDVGGVALGSNFIFTVDTCTGPGNQSFCSYTKGGYQGGGTPGQIFTANFTSTFPSGMTIGVNDGLGPFHHHIWTSNSAGMATLQSYLTSPAGPSTALPTDLVNPASSFSGQLSEQVAALTLNVHFSGTVSSMPAGFGDLKLKNTGTSLDGATISTILAIANNSLSGQGLPIGYTFSSLSDLITNLNESWDDCSQSAWAKEHLE